MEHKSCKKTNSTQESELVLEGDYLRCPACGYRERTYSHEEVKTKFSFETSHKTKKKNSYR